MGNLGDIDDTEVDELIAQVVDEVRRHFSSDRMAMLLTEQTAAPLHAAAALSHCCVLAEELVAAYLRDRELIGRLISRALFESWAHGYFVHLGGLPALEEIAGSWLATTQSQTNDLAEHASQVRAAKRKHRKSKKNWEAIAKRAPERAGAEPFDLSTPTESGLSPEALALPNWDIVPKKLPVLDVVRRLGRLEDERKGSLAFELSYHLLYRTLSNTAAHASLWVMNAYLDGRDGDAWFVRVRRDPHLPASLREPDRQAALVLTAALSWVIFKNRDLQCPWATSVLVRSGAVEGSASAQ